MFKALFNVLFGVIVGIVNIILTPINLLVSGLIPDVSQMIATFNAGVTMFFNSSLNYFFSILPPNCRTFIIIYLLFLISYYTISFSVHAIVKVYKIIKAVKIW